MFSSSCAHPLAPSGAFRMGSFGAPKSGVPLGTDHCGAPVLPATCQAKPARDRWSGAGMEAGNYPMRQLPGVPSVTPGWEAGPRVPERSIPARGAKFRALDWSAGQALWAGPGTGLRGQKGQGILHTGDEPLTHCSCGGGLLGALGAWGGGEPERQVRHVNAGP